MKDKFKKKRIDRWLEMDYVNMEISKAEVRVWFEDGSNKAYSETRAYRWSRIASYCVIPVGVTLFFLIEFLMH